jgi:hypothetical protein
MKLFFLMFFLIASCSVIDDFNRKEFTYEGKEREHKLVLHIPRGYKEEKKMLDTAGGKEQFYYYSNGALIYFTNKVSWPTENDSIIRQMKPVSTDGESFVYRGMDKDGLYWKEIRHESFRFGYSYVPKSNIDRFEKAVNTVRMR